jgi:hypothetical protein
MPGSLYWPPDEAPAFDGLAAGRRAPDPPVNAEFNWWLLIVGLVAGAALVWLVLADSARRDADVEADEIPMEAAWIAATMRDDGEEVDPRTADRVLRLHRAYLSAPPPDGPDRTAMARLRPLAGGPATPPEAAEMAADAAARAALAEPAEQTAAPRRRRRKATPPAD